MRTAGSELASEANLLGTDWIPDVVLATDMMNVSDFRQGLGADYPVALYMHENQLTYGKDPDLEFAGINVDSVAAADLVVFNSRYHRESFGGALRSFDNDKATGRWEESMVVPVGIDFAGFKQRPPESKVSPLPTKTTLAFACPLGR